MIDFIQQLSGDRKLILADAFLNPVFKDLIQHNLNYWRQRRENISPSSSDVEIAKQFREVSSYLDVWTQLKEAVDKITAELQHLNSQVEK